MKTTLSVSAWVSLLSSLTCRSWQEFEERLKENSRPVGKHPNPQYLVPKK